MFSLHHLRYFLAAADLQSIAKAAEQVHVTPSALSQAITTLERDLDTKLLVHQRKKFQLTAAGRLLHQKGQHLLGEIQGIRNDLLREEGRDEGEFVFMTQQSIAGTRLPHLLGTFLKRWPQIRPQVLIGTREEVDAALIAGRINFAITVDGMMPKSPLHYEKVANGNYQLFGDARYWSGSETPWFRHLILSDEETPEVKNLKVLVKEKYKTAALPRFFIKSWSVAVEMAAQGLGVAFVPEYVLQRYEAGRRGSASKAQQGQTMPWPFRRTIPYGVYAVRQRDQALCSCSRRFLDHVTEEF